jgi:hypothetical protein
VYRVVAAILRSCHVLLSRRPAAVTSFTNPLAVL